MIESDARDFQGTAPLVLLDAPCTATGTIRRHPDLPWIKGAADVTAQASLAYDLLESAAAMVEPGGLLVFAVCSLEREEGEEQVAAFLDAHPEFARAPVTAAMSSVMRMDHGRRRSAHLALSSARIGRDGRLLCARLRRLYPRFSRGVILRQAQDEEMG